MSEDVKLTPDEVVFIGLGRSVPCWYRCALPAMRLGADWVGISGAPPGDYVTGNTFKKPEPGEYKVYIIQQPAGPQWLQCIRRLKREGAIVLYEIDDYVHGARYLVQQGQRIEKTRERLRHYEMCMMACDGLIASTEFIAQRYSKYNKRTWVCPNGIDLGRYHVTRPERDVPVLGWFGGAGHEESLSQWWPEVEETLWLLPDVKFAAIGQQYEIFDSIPKERLITIPFVHLEGLPGVLAHIDVAIAPAEQSDFFKGKSDLRFLECGAASLAAVYDERHYMIPQGCGFPVTYGNDRTEAMCMLLENKAERLEMGATARKYVEENRSDAATVETWIDLLEEIASEFD